MKRGWRSTEFWGKVVVQLVLLINSIWFDLMRIEVSDEVAWIIIGGLEGLYMVWRSALKARKVNA